MIKFDQLKFNNWISFYGNQPPIVFSGNETQNITFILADNEAGKTSILRGIQWCMFGNTNDPKKYKKHLERLNFQAAEEKIYSYSVELKLIFNGENYIIKRAAYIDHNSELKEQNFQEELVCNINGNILKDKRAEKAIHEIFDLNSSRFYLFDGEMLDEYETLLVSNNVSELSKKIKESIENLLQVTPLKHARKSLESITNRANKDYQADDANNQQARQIAKKIQAIDIDIEAFNKEEEKLLEKKAEYQSNYNNAQDVLTKNSSEKTKGQRLDEINNNLIPSLKEKIKNTEIQLAQLCKTSYLGIVENITKKNIDKLKKNRDTLIKKQNTFLNNKLYKDLIDDTNISKESSDIIKSYISESSSKSETQIEDELYRAKSNIKNLKKLDSGSSNLNLQLNIYETLANNREEIISLESEGNNILEEIGKGSAEIIKNASNDMKTYSGLIAEINLALNPEKEGTIAFNIQKLQKDKDLLNSSMPHDSGDRTLSSVKLEMSKKYQAFFDNLVNEMIEKSKDDIENKANKIYQELREFKNIEDASPEETDLRLVINDNYGISVKSGNKDLIASAGGSQIIALSLIFALRNILESEAPILMDTPMARLDNNYRKGLLEVAPNQGTQFILLVHDGELDPGSTLYDTIRPKIDKKYKLNKKNVRNTEILRD